VTLTQAQAQLDTLARRLARDYPGSNAGRGFRLAPLDKAYASIEPKSVEGLLLVLGAVAFVLLIACANVTNLLFARAVRRYRECVIRAALGASRARLVRQLLVEHMLLFLVGGVLAIILAGWSVDSLVSLAVVSHYLPERMSVAVDGRVFLFSLFVSLLAGLSFGLSPALQASRVDLTEGLKASSQTLKGGRGRHRASRLLMVSELALSVVLLVGFGLLARSFMRVYEDSGGFSRENLLVTESDGGRSFMPALAFWRRALEEARRDPGVRLAAVTSRPPVHGVRRVSFAIDGHALSSPGEDAGDVLISADYFRTMGIRLIKGRAFTERDDGSAPPVVVISESVARATFGNQNPLGHRLHIDDHGFTSCCSAAGPVEGVWREIVGVVGDVRQGNLDEPPAMTLYRPYSQMVEHDMYLVVRAASARDASRLARTLGARLLTLDPNQEWADVRPMSDVIDGSESIRLRRFVLVLLGSFAGLALLLAGIGTYGVMAYAVAGRTQEIGIRMALGATRLAVFRQILAETLTMTLAGIAIGGVGAYLLSRFIAAMLVGVSATDVATYAGVSLLLVGVALAASYLPARRATRVDPSTALREQ
jgi:putative ABC transport system permease protein